MRPHHLRFVIATRRTLLGVGAAALLAAPPGCGLFGSGGGDDGPPPAAMSATTRPTLSDSVQTYTGSVPGVLQPIDRPIVQTELPLIYLCETAGTLQVTSVDTGEQILTLDVKPLQILRVESRGVYLANERVLGATLAPGRYAIYQLSNNAGVVRTTRTHTTPTMQPPSESPAQRPEPPAQPAAPAAAGDPPADTPPPQ